MPQWLASGVAFGVSVGLGPAFAPVLMKTVLVRMCLI
jgi:hypothetical protein